MEQETEDLLVLIIGLPLIGLLFIWGFRQITKEAGEFKNLSKQNFNREFNIDTAFWLILSAGMLLAMRC